MYQAYYLFVIIFEPLAICTIFYLVFSKRGREVVYIGYRIGLAFAAIGMLDEVHWSAYQLRYGTPPTFSSIPFWLGKDFGYAIITSTYLWRRIRGVHDKFLTAEIEKKGEMNS